MEKQNSSLFDVIIDSNIEELRQQAKNGDFDAMIELGGHIADGHLTRKNEKLALTIFNYALENKDRIRSNPSLCNALIWKIQIIQDTDEAEAASLCIEVIRHITSLPIEHWSFDYLNSAIEWLECYKINYETGNGSES